MKIARFSILDRDQSVPRGLYDLSGEDALSELKTLNEGRTDGQYFELWLDGKPLGTQGLADLRVKITRIEVMDPVAYDIDIIHLSDGRVIYAWNGSAGYDVRNEAKGCVLVGSALAAVTEATSYSGEKFNIYHFAS